MVYDKATARLKADPGVEEFMEQLRETRTDPPFVPTAGFSTTFKVVYDGLQAQASPMPGLYPTWRLEIVVDGNETDINGVVWKAADGWHEQTIYDRASKTLIEALQKVFADLLVYCQLRDIG